MLTDQLIEYTIKVFPIQRRSLSMRLFDLRRHRRLLRYCHWQQRTGLRPGGVDLMLKQTTPANHLFIMNIYVQPDAPWDHRRWMTQEIHLKLPDWRHSGVAVVGMVQESSQELFFWRFALLLPPRAQFWAAPRVECALFWRQTDLPLTLNGPNSISVWPYFCELKDRFRCARPRLSRAT